MEDHSSSTQYDNHLTLLIKTGNNSHKQLMIPQTFIRSFQLVGGEKV